MHSHAKLIIIFLPVNFLGADIMRYSSKSWISVYHGYMALCALLMIDVEGPLLSFIDGQ